MKKIAVFALILVLILSCLSGCAEKENTPDGTPEKTVDETELQDTPETDIPSTDDLPQESTADDGYSFSVAQMMIDHPVDELYELIGKPNDSSYASSCMGDGEDGELYYDGFTVCTYLEGELETVVDVYK